MEERRLYRSRSDRMVAGVAGGIAEYFGIDPTVVRIAIVVAALVTNGGVLLAYVIMAIVVPEEPLEAAPDAPYAAPGTPPAPGAAPGAAPAEGMGPGDMPEPGEFGRPAVPDPSEGVAPPHPETPPPTTTPTAPYPQPAAVPREPAGRREGRGPWVIGLVLIGVGLFLLFERFLDFDLWRLWPLILIAIGISIMFRRKG